MGKLDYDNWLQKCPHCGKYIQDSLDFPQCSCGCSEREEGFPEEDWSEERLYEEGLKRR